MKIIFAGTPDFAVPTLEMLLTSGHQVVAVYTQPDRPAGRGRKLQPGPIKEIALKAGIPVFQPAGFKSPEDLEQLASLHTDLMIVVAYGMILPQTVLDAPRLGCINVHASLLPRWRGAAPIQRAIMAGDRQTGVTIMRIALKLDAGDMLHKEEIPIGPHDTADELHDKLAALGARGLARVLPELASGRIHAERQDERLVTYAHKLEKSEAELDWAQPAIELDRKIRGLCSWPVAQTVFDGKALRLWRAEIAGGRAEAEPGTVINSRKTMEVATGDGILRLLEVQLPGGKRMPIEAFLNAHDVNGIKLG